MLSSVEQVGLRMTIESLFNPATWIEDAEHEHDLEVFFEEEEEEIEPDML